MEETENLLKIWEKSSLEFQNNNFEMFKNLLAEIKDSEYSLIKLMDATKEQFFQNKGEELVHLIKEDEENKTFVTLLWARLSPKIQLDNKELFGKLLDSSKRNEMNFETLWSGTTGKLQKQFFSDALEQEEVLKGANFCLSIDYFKQYAISRNLINEEQIASAYNQYVELYKTNPQVNSTINLEFLDKTILSHFGKEQTTRLTMYPELQDKIINLKDNNTFLNLLQYISTSSPNWSLELNSVLRNVHNFEALINNLKGENLDKTLSDKLIQVLAQKDNYFEINDIQQLENFDDIRREKCLQILNGQSNVEIDGLNENDKMKFAVLELLYGIDLDEATNLVQKYGAEIETIDDGKAGKETIATILGMKRLLECNNVQELFEQNRDVFESGDIANIRYSSIARLETACLNMYEKLYAESLYEPKEEDKSEVVEYNGQKIQVYDIKDNFNMFIRTEGACNGYNVAKQLDIKYHGNCKSFIGQDLLAITSGQGPKFGYSTCKENSLLLSAPWDIMSNRVNKDFSIASARWNENCGIQFRTPQGVKDNTRHNYNEFVSERLIFDKETESFKNDVPQYVVYIEEPGVNREEDDLWRISKEAASQMNLPIVTINRERFAMKEAEEIHRLEDIFQGKVENTENIPETKILEQIITKFENNATGNQTSKIITDKYFSSDRRNEMISNVWKRVKSFKDTDIQKYADLVDKFIEVSEKEQSKTISNTGSKVASEIYGDAFIDSLRSRKKEIANLEKPETTKKSETTKETQELLKAKLCKTYVEFSIENEDVSKAKQSLQREDRILGQEQK